MRPQKTFTLTACGVMVLPPSCLDRGQHCPEAIPSVSLGDLYVTHNQNWPLKNMCVAAGSGLQS